jgi:oligoendopeptidase F
MSNPRTWNLEMVYPSIHDTAFIQDLDKVTASIEVLLTKVDQVTQQSSWESFLKELEQTGMLLSQLGVYVNCLASGDTANTEYPALLGKISALGARAAEITISLKQQLKGLTDQEYEAVLKSSAWLTEIRFSIDEMRTEAKFMMDGPRETLAAQLSVDGISAWGRLYTKLSGSLKVQLMEKGELVTKSVGQVRFDSPEPTVRKNNFYAADKAWQTIQDSCAAAINHISGTRLTLYKQRGYDHFLDKPLQDNRLQKQSLDAMWGAITNRKSFLIPYLETKARILGLPKLAWYDQTAPIGTGSIDFDQAAETIIREFGRFNPEMGTFAADALAKGFVESEDRSNKRPGAYCTKFSLRKEPRIFMTFNDTYDAMSTLAHELGHGYHGFVLKDQPQALQSYVMCTAETASTFVEEIINEYLMENAPSPQQKLSLLDKSLSDSMIMLMNIHARFIFESQFYTLRQKGEVRIEELNDLMVQAQKEAFLDQLAEYDPRFWANKLHFYISGLSFYNFPYTFGYLFSTGLFAQAKAQGPAFAQTYRDILIATGCKSTEEVISSTLGQDIRTPDFWNKSLDLIEHRVGEFLALAKDLGY